MFGSHALFYTGTTNANKPRTVPSIALHRLNNSGGHYFISLHSGRKTHGHDWEELPIDKHVIERVDDLSDSEKQPVMNRGMNKFERAKGTPTNDELEDEPEQVLTISDYEPGEQKSIEDNADLEIIEDSVEENYLEIQEEVLEPAVEEGLIIVPECNIFREEEVFFEKEGDELSDGDIEKN